jgi:hypothetical protein
VTELWGGGGQAPPNNSEASWRQAGEADPIACQPDPPSRPPEPPPFFGFERPRLLKRPPDKVPPARQNTSTAGGERWGKSNNFFKIFIVIIFLSGDEWDNAEEIVCNTVRVCKYQTVEPNENGRVRFQAPSPLCSQPCVLKNYQIG